jgi:hypothetical protein
MKRIRRRVWTMMDARPPVAHCGRPCRAWRVSARAVGRRRFLETIALRNPQVFHALACAYTKCWFTTPFLAASLLRSVLAIVAYRHLCRFMRTRSRATGSRRTDRRSRASAVTHMTRAHSDAHPIPTWLTVTSEVSTRAS